MHTDPTPYLFWITSRAAGIAALVLASLSVSLGLMMSTKVMRKRIADLRATHEILALSTIAAIVIHAGSLLFDQWLHPSLAAITIPFVGNYKSVWTSIGIVAGWSTIVLGLSYYARRRIGAVRWRKLHRFSALAWLAGLVHAVGDGTDAGQIWFLAMIAVVVLPALALLAARLSGLGSRKPAAQLSGRASRKPAPRPPARPVRPEAVAKPARTGAHHQPLWAEHATTR